MKFELLICLALFSVPQMCRYYSDCYSYCPSHIGYCTNITCNLTDLCTTTNLSCCFGGVCRNEKYCSPCSSHEECESKCCNQGNCNSPDQCPYFPIGMACSFDYQCASYQCVSDSCVDVVGTACSNHTGCTTKCCYNGKCQLDQKVLCPALQINMTCSHNWDCDTYICEASRCKAALTGRCYSHEDCQSGCCKNSRCDAINKCSMKVAQDECANDYECISNRCMTFKCMSRTNEVCSDHNECEYQCCHEGICGFGCKYLQSGVECLTHGDCASYICKSGICVNGQGGWCSHHNQCKSGFCLNNTCFANLTHQKNLSPSAICQYDYDCKSYMCINGLCFAGSGSCRSHSECNSKCCIDFKCSANSNYCYHSENNAQCNYNWNCISGLCSNGVCVNSFDELSTHKNAGEMCVDDSECRHGYCNEVCLGLNGELCLSHYQCFIGQYNMNYNAYTYTATCSNHICQVVSIYNEFCEVNEDCIYLSQFTSRYGSYRFMTSSFCIHGKCMLLNNEYYIQNGSTICASNCTSRSMNYYGLDNCVPYTYCTKTQGQLCQTHRDCSSGCCYKNNTMTQSLCSTLCLNKTNTQSCTTHYDCSSFYCNPSTTKCQTRPCIYHQECMTGCCSNGVCTTTCNLLPVLSSCSTNYQCLSSLCLSGKCKLYIWNTCTAFNECQTGCCNNGVCKANTTDNCPFKSNYEQCLQNHECTSNACSSTLNICMALIGEPSCVTHQYCVSGCCGSDLKCHDSLDLAHCKIYPVEHLCSSNFECFSYICDNKKCKYNISESCSSHFECVTNYCNENCICTELKTILLKGGDICTSNTECESYVCTGVCNALPGYSCESHTHCLSGCCGSDKKCSINTNYEICIFLDVESRCNDNFECRSYLCVKEKCLNNNGEFCSNHSNCNSVYCDEFNICSVLTITLKKGGEYCTDHYECESYYCNIICKSLLEFSCHSHTHCLSGCCGKDELCHITWNYDTCSIGINEYCTDNYQCRSYLCYGDLCKQNNGDYCNSHNQCKSEFCFYDTCNDLNITLIKGWESCTTNGECKSYDCYIGNCKVLLGYPCSSHMHCVNGCCGDDMLCKNSYECNFLFIGTPCDSNSQCESYLCHQGICKLKNGDYCHYYHLNCASTYCNNINICDNLTFTLKTTDMNCNNPSECMSYNCSYGKCRGSINENCDSHAKCVSECCIQNYCADYCPNFGEGNSCTENYECISYNCNNSICYEYHPPMCSNHIECKEGFCCGADNYCIQSLDYPKCGKMIGEHCNFDYECSNYKCDDTKYICVNLYCNQHSECSSNFCYSGICLDNEICVLKEIGSYCTNSYECKSYQCLGYKCADQINKPCSSHADCSTECCFNNTCQFTTDSICPNRKLMEQCKTNSECKNYECKTNLCLLKDKDKCQIHTECGSRCCFNGSCKSNEDCILLANGLPCKRHYECNSSKCRKNECVGIEGDICRNHHECESGCCVNGNCSNYCFHYRTGYACVNHWDCESYICSETKICVGNIDDVCFSHKLCNSGCCHGVCTKMPSDFCLLNNGGSECEENSHCADYICKGKKCLELPGDECSNHSICPSGCCIGSRCSDEQNKMLCLNMKTNDACHWNHECASLICGQEHKCIGLDGDKCNGHSECFSGCCSRGSCKILNKTNCPMKLTGELCYSAPECLSFKCAYDICSGFDGDICKNHTWCISGCCKDGYCQPINKCDQLSLGNVCIQNDNCTSYDCQNGYCVGENNIECENHKYCKSSCCLYSLCSPFENCRAINSGGWCKTDIDCKSFNCILAYNKTDGICYSDIGMSCKNHTECMDRCCYRNEFSENCEKSSTCLNMSINSRCAYDNDCSNFYCNENTHMCANFTGKYCSDHQSCYYGCCYDGKCSKDMCPHDLPNSPCNSNYTCSSYLCSSGKCKIALSDWCSSHESCESGCCSKGICQPNNTFNCKYISNFENCFENSDCQSYNCSKNLGVCIAKINDNCVNHRHCISGCCSKDLKCHLTSDHESCPLLGGGENCNENYQCNSNYCAAEKCQSYFGDKCFSHLGCYKGYCINNICTDLPTNLKNIGEGCVSNIECISMICIDNTCKNNEDSICLNHKSCQSGCCYLGELCKPITMCYNKPAGSPCKANYECASFSCANDYCDGKKETSCRHHFNCEVGKCCINDYCAISESYPTCGAKINASCTLNSDCSSYVCRNQICIGLACRKHENCASRCCDDGFYCGAKDCSPKYDGGQACVSNYECASYSCAKGKCRVKSGAGKSVCIWILLLMMAILL